MTLEGYNLARIQDELLSGTLTMVSVVDYYLSKIESDKVYNAEVEVFTSEVLDKAILLDAKINSRPEELGELFGAVVSIKDNICFADHKVSAGSKMLKDYMSPFSATVVDRLIAEDAIIISRTNCDEFSMGSSSESSYYGAVLNAIDSSRVAGGSSGGAAVSVSLNHCLIALGSDTGGSIRQPACFNGVLGYKPSYGSLSRWGLIAYGSSLDQIGVIANDVEDVIKAMQVMEGADGRDNKLYQEKIFQSNHVDNDNVYKIAKFSNLFCSEMLDENVLKSSETALEKIDNAGFRIDDISFPYADWLLPCYYIISSAEASSNLARYDGIRYGTSEEKSDDQSFRDLIRNNRTEAFGWELKKRIILGNYVLSEGFQDAYFKKANQIRRVLKQYFVELFDNYDFIILPIVSSGPWKLNDTNRNPMANYFSDIFTVIANLIGFPSISVPINNNFGELPFGIQILAKSKNDCSLLQFVEKLPKL